MAVLRAKFGTDTSEGWCEAAAVVGQHVGEAEREGFRGLAPKAMAMALRSVSSSLTARWTVRNRRSMAT